MLIIMYISRIHQQIKSVYLVTCTQKYDCVQEYETLNRSATTLP